MLLFGLEISKLLKEGWNKVNRIAIIISIRLEQLQVVTGTQK